MSAKRLGMLSRPCQVGLKLELSHYPFGARSVPTQIQPRQNHHLIVVEGANTVDKSAGNEITSHTKIE